MHYKNVHYKKGIKTFLGSTGNDGKEAQSPARPYLGRTNFSPLTGHVTSPRLRGARPSRGRRVCRSRCKSAWPRRRARAASLRPCVPPPQGKPDARPSPGRSEDPDRQTETRPVHPRPASRCSVPCFPRCQEYRAFARSPLPGSTRLQMPRTHSRRRGQLSPLATFGRYPVRFESCAFR
jgi:hypothetical protein